ncbi:MAG: hypothetical protein EHM15_11255 [Desulfobacteraceae bacterium]|nr:MAG: hypothetical protein EHM15_11255 [Desulfobacteraceae bacterium]
MLLSQLYHPPRVEIDRTRSDNGELVLVHRFEGKPLVREFIANTLLGIEFLWGRPVQLETSEAVHAAAAPGPAAAQAPPHRERRAEATVWQRVRYTMKDRKLTRDVI